jgi:hypothetical protein
MLEDALIALDLAIDLDDQSEVKKLTPIEDTVHH